MIAPTCVICGKRASTYVCQDCGRLVCSNCFDPLHWSCSDCQIKLGRPPEAKYEPFSTATWLFFIAFAVILTGTLLMALGSISNLQPASGGAVILIGPIPIVLGAGPYSIPLIALAAILTIFALAFFHVLRRKT